MEKIRRRNMEKGKDKKEERRWMEKIWRRRQRS